MAKKKYPEIPNQASFTISEASELCNVEQHILRYWESLYKKLSKVKRRNNRRYYSLDDIHTIRKINDLKDSGLNSKAIAKQIDKNQISSAERDDKTAMIKFRSELQSIIKLLD